LLSASCALLLTSTLATAQDTTAAGKTKASKSGVKKSTAVAHKTSGKGKKSSKSASSRRRGQQQIDSDRTQQIQQALVREHYLSEPSGKWDDATQKAMQKYQADHGWQSKTVPDSRALIKLGLGPNHDHLLNPESAMTSSPSNNLPSANNSPSSSGGPQGPSNQPQ
jgi:hypothetical protein